MMGLSDGRKSFPIGLAVFIQYRSVTASHPASHPATQPASHVAVAITLNAKASSLKTEDRTYNDFVRDCLCCIYSGAISGQSLAVVRSSGWRHSSDHHWSLGECFRCQVGLLRDPERYHRQTEVSVVHQSISV